jgi:hypothetical protein
MTVMAAGFVFTPAQQMRDESASFAESSLAELRDEGRPEMEDLVLRRLEGRVNRPR